MHGRSGHALQRMSQPEGLPAVVAESGLAALSSEAEGEAAVPVDALPKVPAVPPELVGAPTNGAPACIYARMSQDILTGHSHMPLQTCAGCMLCCAKIACLSSWLQF